MKKSNENLYIDRSGRLHGAYGQLQLATHEYDHSRYSGMVHSTLVDRWIER